MSVDEKALTPYVKRRLADYRKNVPAHVMASKNYPENLKPLFLALIANDHVRAMEIYFVDVLGATRVEGLTGGNPAHAYKFPPPTTADMAIEALSSMRSSWDDWIKAQIDFFSLMEKCTEIYNNIQHSPRDTQYIERARDTLRTEKDTFARIDRDPDSAHVWESYHLPLYTKTIAALSQQIDTVKHNERVALAKAFRAELSHDLKKFQASLDAFAQPARADRTTHARPPEPVPAPPVAASTGTTAPDSPSSSEPESFCDAAMLILEWARATEPFDAHGRKQHIWKWEWSSVEQLFAQLEKAYDPSFYLTGVAAITGTPAEIQRQRDSVVMERQRAAAAALWQCDPELAGRYAEILRTVAKPAGLPKSERRDAMLEEFDRLAKQAAPLASLLPHPPHTTSPHIKWVTKVDAARQLNISGPECIHQGVPNKTVFIDDEDWLIHDMSYSEYETPGAISYDKTNTVHYRHVTRRIILSIARGTVSRILTIHPDFAEFPRDLTPLAIVMTDDFKQCPGSLNAWVQFVEEPIAHSCFVESREVPSLPKSASLSLPTTHRVIEWLNRRMGLLANLADRIPPGHRLESFWRALLVDRDIGKAVAIHEQLEGKKLLPSDVQGFRFLLDCPRYVVALRDFSVFAIHAYDRIKNHRLDASFLRATYLDLSREKERACVQLLDGSPEGRDFAAFVEQTAAQMDGTFRQLIEIAERKATDKQRSSQAADLLAIVMHHADVLRAIMPPKTHSAVTPARVKPPGKIRGRKREYNPLQDERLLDAWKTGAFPKYEDLANEKNMKTGDVVRALQRARARARAKARG